MFNYGTNQVSYTVSEKTKVLNEDCDSTVDFTSSVIGDFGKWQLRMSVMMSLLRFPVAWFLLEIIFLAPPQRFWCQKPESFEVYSDAEWREICCPKRNNPCVIYDPDVLKNDPDFDRRFMPVVDCPKFVYDKQVFNSTITSEWDLVCSRFWLVHLSQCSMMCGVLLGGVVFGGMADKHGRKNLLMICIAIQAVTSFVLAAVFAFWQFLLVRFILALASGGIGIISFVVCVEVVGGKWRTTIPILYHLPFSLGNTVMAVIAYYLRDWRKFELCLAFLCALFILYWFWLPESPRWLLATGQINEAVVVLKKIARINNMSENFDKAMNMLPINQVKTSNNLGFMAFIKSENMRKKTVLLSTNWLCLGVGFCAFSQYLESIGDNIFLTVALSGVISAPGGIACVLIVTKVGRKTTVAGFQIMTALCFVFTLLTPKGVFPYDWPRLFFAGLGLAGMAGSVPSLFLFTGELYPTVARNVGVGGVTIFARIGSMLAPAVVALDSIMDNLPLIILATMSFLQVLTLLPLPETKDCPLPETLEQAEKFTTEFSHRHRRSNERRRKRESRTS